MGQLVNSVSVSKFDGGERFVFRGGSEVFQTDRQKAETLLVMLATQLGYYIAKPYELKILGKANVTEPKFS